MSGYTDRIAREQGVVVSHEQAAAVAADLARALDAAHETTLGHARAAGVIPSGTSVVLGAFTSGYGLAVDLIRETVLAHRDPEAHKGGMS